MACGVVFAVLALPLQAQRTTARSRSTAAYGTRLGPHIGYSFDAEEALLGAQAVFPVAPAFDLYPSFDFYLVSGGSLWALNFDARYRPPMRATVAAYVGGGLNYMRASAGGFSASDTKLNLFGGIESRRMRAAPFGEARLQLGDGSNFQIVGGVHFRLR
jgi:hypothetical protein